MFDPGGKRQYEWTTNEGHGPMIHEAPTLVDSDATTLKRTKLQPTCFVVIGALVKQPELHEHASSCVSICSITVDNSKLSEPCAENYMTFEGGSPIYERFGNYLFPNFSITLGNATENVIYNFFFNEITTFTLLCNAQLEREINRFTGVMKEEHVSILSTCVSFVGVGIDSVAPRLLILPEENITWLILCIVDDSFDGDCSLKMMEPLLDQRTPIEMAMERCMRVNHCELVCPITKEVTFCKMFANYLHAPTMSFNFMAAPPMLRDIFETNYGVVGRRLIVVQWEKCVIHSRSSEKGNDTFGMHDATGSIVSLTKSYSKFDEMHTTSPSICVQPFMFGAQAAKSNGDNEEIYPMNDHFNDLIVSYKCARELDEFFEEPEVLY